MWIDEMGYVRCTCIGSTDYRVHSLAGTFREPCCVHAISITSLLEELGCVIGVTAAVCGTTLNNIVTAHFQGGYDNYVEHLPAFTYVHRKDIAVLVNKESVNKSSSKNVILRF